MQETGTDECDLVDSVKRLRSEPEKMCNEHLLPEKSQIFPVTALGAFSQNFKPNERLKRIG